MAAPQPSAAVDSLHYAQVVGDTFVNQYYHYLQHSRELVHRFYQEHSRLGRADDQGNVASVTTIDAINEKILSMESCSSEIKKVNCQDSLNGGVIVIVTGYLIRKEDNVKRDFVQSFFLAPQEKGYFVLNDVLLYGQEFGRQPEQQGLSNGTGSSFLTENDSQQKESLSMDEMGARMCGVDNRLSNGGSSTLLEEELSNEVTDEDYYPPLVVKTKDKNTCQESPKKSYASVLVKALKDNASVPEPPASHGPTSSSSATESKKIQKAEFDSHSVFLKNLPLDATSAQVEEAFKRFGPIKPGGIQVRSHKLQNSCFGFLEFKSASSVWSAVEASPIIISGCQVYVKEKRILAPGANNKGKFAQNKAGGYQNDGTRENGGNNGNWRSSAREGIENKLDSGSRVGNRRYPSNGGEFWSHRVDQVGSNYGQGSHTG